jgi:hypothetical protein
VVAGALTFATVALTAAGWGVLAPQQPRLVAIVVALGGFGAALALGASAMTGRTVEPLRSWIRSLSGSAP